MTAQAVERNLTPTEIVARYAGSVPVDVERIADALSLAVVHDPDLPDDVSGRIERSGDWSPYVVTINARHSDTRKRFTLAHEIAHFVLHRDLIGDGLTDDALYRGRLSNGEVFGQYRETEANRYAAELLMPAAAMRARWRTGMRSFADFAATFGVSAAAARIRLKELGYGA